MKLKLDFYSILFLLNFVSTLGYYAPPSRPKGPRRRIDRGNAGGALVFFPQLLWLLYAMGVYTYQKIHLAKKFLWPN